MKKWIISEKEADEIEECLVDNPNLTTEEVMKKYNLTLELAFSLIKGASKKLDKSNN